MIHDSFPPARLALLRRRVVTASAVIDGFLPATALARVRLISGGSGGGSGARGDTSVSRYGGGGGAGGLTREAFLDASDYAGQQFYADVGAGGLGGSSAASDGASGNGGALGTRTVLYSATTGRTIIATETNTFPGQGGTTTSGSAGGPVTPGQTSEYFIVSGGTGSNSAGQPSPYGYVRGPGPGGGGGGLNTSGAEAAGGAGAFGSFQWAFLNSGMEVPAGGTAHGGPGTSGTDHLTGDVPGSGGGGGGSNATGPGGAGGKGGFPGGAGGGGGASGVGFASGAGGPGGNGCIIIDEYGAA